MSQPLSIKSFRNENITERSELALDAPAGAEALLIEDTSGFLAGQTIYIGTPGLDGCERAVVLSVTDPTTLNLTSPLQLPHRCYESVLAVLGDRVRVRRAVNVDDRVPLIETFSPLASRGIQADRPDTYYTDSTGGAGYWYVLTNWNELTDEETPLDLRNAVRGDDFARYATLDAIRKEAGFENAVNLDDTTVDQQRRAAETEINSALSNSYTTPFKPVPDAVRVLTEKLTAALLRFNAYGSKYQKMLDDARAAVQAYADQGATITDENGNSLSTTDGVGYDFGDQPRMFSVEQKF